MTHKVRTTFNPDVEIEVGDAEYTDLARQGLLAPERMPEPVQDKNRRANAPSAGKEEN